MIELVDGQHVMAMLMDSVPESYQFGESVVIPLRAGEKLRWKCERC